MFESPWSPWHVYDHYGYAAAAMFGTLAAVVAVHRLLAARRWAGWVASLQGVAPPFINIVGVLFGLTLAFLANDTWSAHDRAIRSVYKESDGLRSLVTLAEPLPEPMRQHLGAALVAYADASVAEWPALQLRRESPEVLQRADALLRLLASREMAAAAGDNVQALMLRKALEVRDERDQRVSLSQTHVNPLKWLGMAFLGLLTMISVAVVHVDRPRAALVAIVLFALAAAPTAAIVLIQGNPFQAPSAVTPDAIATAVTALRAH